MDKINIRNIKKSEFLDIYEFVSDCKPLEVYPEHLYKIMFRYFGDKCYIAEYSNDIVGFIMGFISQRNNNTYFIWQIGVSPDFQGKSIGSKMLCELEDKLKKIDIKRIEVTVDPENIPSKNLFEKSGYKNISRQEGEVVKIKESFAVKDYYSPGRDFILYEKNI